MANVSIRKVVEFYRTKPKDNSLLLSGDPDLVAFQRNFHVLRSNAPLALARFVQSKFALMAQTHSGMAAPTSNLVDIDPAFDTTRAIAFSWPGGRFRSGPGDPPYQHHDTHKIYFCPASRAMDVSGIGYAICHELGHYVDPASDDYAYFARDPNKYNNLAPSLAQHNGDSYAQFAFECAGAPSFNALDHLKFN